MATTNPGHNINDIKPLDATRLRLFQLSNELGVLRQAIETSDPLPPWSTILRSSNLLSVQLGSLTEHLATAFNAHSDPALSNFSLGGQPHAYPLPSFPIEQENILGQLLRKKLDPGVEEWVERASAAAASKDHRGIEYKVLNREQQEELWAWAKPRAGEIAAGIPWGIDYSIAEQEAGVETVITGLKRKLDTGLESDDEDDDEDDDRDDGEDKHMEDVGGGSKKQNITTQDLLTASLKPVIPLDDMLRFMSTGTLPRTGPPGMTGAPRG